MFSEKALKTMKADALSIIEDPTLVAELEKNVRGRKHEKGNLEDGMVFKSGEEKAVEMEIEVGMEDRPYGGATTLKEAKTYIKNLERAQEFGEGMLLFEGVLDNILNSDLTLTEKEKRLGALLQEAKRIISEGKVIGKNKSQTGGKRMGYPSIRGSTSLKGAMRNLVSSLGGQDAQISLGTVVRLVGREIANLPPGQRERAFAQLKADLKAFPGTGKPEKGSIRWHAELSSGLNPQTGRPIEEHTPTIEEITQKGMVSIEKAIRDSAARQAKARGEPVRETSSVKRAAMRSSGLDPDTNEVLF